MVACKTITVSEENLTGMLLRIHMLAARRGLIIDGYKAYTVPAKSFVLAYPTRRNVQFTSLSFVLPHTSKKDVVLS